MALSLMKSIYGVNSRNNSMFLDDNDSDCDNETNTYGLSRSLNVLNKKNEGLQTGTTIVSIAYKDGVIMGADSRSSVSSTYVANRLTNKLQKLFDNVYIQRSGSSAHTQNIGDYVSHYLNIHSMELNELPRVETAAKLVQSIVYSNKNWVSASIIVVGYDKYNGGSIYYCPMGATLAKKLPFAIAGSGSVYIYGFMDENYKANLSKNDALKLVKRAVSLAIYRDGSSGGVVRTLVIDKNGCERQTFEPDNIDAKQ